MACAVLGIAAEAHADRKRVVVLAFEGPRAEKFHDDVVRLIKKVHTVVSTEKWNGAAEELNAAAVSDRNIKKVANKLKIDAVIEGKIEKRRDDYLIRLKLHDGKSGELVGSPVATKAEGPRIDGRAQREIQDELVDIIADVESMQAGVVIEDDEDEPAVPAVRKGAKKAEDEPPARKGARKAEDDEPPSRKTRKAEDDEPPSRKTRKAEDDEDEDRPARKGFAKLSDDERGADRVGRRSARADEDDEDRPPPRSARRADDEPPKKGAKKAEAEEDAPPPKKPARDDRALARAAAQDAAERDDEAPRRASRSDSGDDEDGARRKSKKVAARDPDSSAEAEVEAAPLDDELALSPGHRALDAVAGVSVTMRRMTFTYRSDLVARPAGYKGRPIGGAMLDATLYPRALGHKHTGLWKDLGVRVMYDRVLFINSRDPMTGMVHPTKESRYSVGAVIRRALWDSPRAIVAIGSLDYSRQVFTISGPANLPSVQYTILEPGGALRIPLTSTIMAGLEARIMLVTSAGRIEATTQYGDTRAIGIEGAFAVDYRINRNLFARAALRAETLQLTFEGNGDLATMRDGDPATQDVSGARDSYLGGLLTVGYLY